MCHERQFHEEQVFEYLCPFSPTRGYSRRSDLQEHYKLHHPCADREEIDDIEPREIVRENKRRTTSSPGSSAEPAVKKKKVKSQNKATQEVLIDPGTSTCIQQLSTDQLEKLAPGSRLTCIKETITIEREYQFQ